MVADLPIVAPPGKEDASEAVCRCCRYLKYCDGSQVADFGWVRENAWVMLLVLGLRPNSPRQSDFGMDEYMDWGLGHSCVLCFVEVNLRRCSLVDQSLSAGAEGKLHHGETEAVAVGCCVRPAQGLALIFCAHLADTYLDKVRVRHFVFLMGCERGVQVPYLGDNHPLLLDTPLHMVDECLVQNERVEAGCGLAVFELGVHDEALACSWFVMVRSPLFCCFLVVSGVENPAAWC